IEGAAELVGPHRRQILPFEEDPRSRLLREVIVFLKRRLGKEIAQGLRCQADALRENAHLPLLARMENLRSSLLLHMKLIEVTSRLRVKRRKRWVRNSIGWVWRLIFGASVIRDLRRQRSKRFAGFTFCTHLRSPSKT